MAAVIVSVSFLVLIAGLIAAWFRTLNADVRTAQKIAEIARESEIEANRLANLAKESEGKAKESVLS